MMMMRRALLIVVVAVAPTLFANQDDVIKGLQNLTAIHRLAVLGEMSVMGGVAPQNPPSDPWGTPYRFEVTANGYRIAGAGSDKKFDETKWGMREQFRNLEDDVVFENAKVIRTNRTWLHEQVTDATRQDLDMLRDAEVLFMMSRTDGVRGVMARRTTESTIESLAAHIGAGGEMSASTRDAWGTPLRVDNPGGKLRIVSAAADRQFNESSWGTAASASFDEDIVYENGGFTRRVDEKALLSSTAMPTPDPLSQPADPPFPTQTTARRVGGDVKAPVIVTRVEPVYSDEYRRARISGIVILETVITDQGEVTDVRVIKSLAPDLDMAAVAAVRQWKFQPGTLDGKPVPVIFNLTINFKLK
jgi:TonB family protein